MAMIPIGKPGIWLGSSAINAKYSSIFIPFQQGAAYHFIRVVHAECHSWEILFLLVSNMIIRCSTVIVKLKAPIFPTKAKSRAREKKNKNELSLVCFLGKK